MTVKVTEISAMVFGYASGFRPNSCLSWIRCSTDESTLRHIQWHEGIGKEADAVYCKARSWQQADILLQITGSLFALTNLLVYTKWFTTLCQYFRSSFPTAH